ncbi:hypothetical protein LCGC14_0998910 [marine sediment metagenome]|uniref:Uncharacterized protein n=1 Tax=marine sediment metagenome TaxID=412755 RepID=A0A0F9NQ61_9ZZZZ
MKRDYQLWKNPDGKTHLSNAGFWTLCGRFVEANWSKYPVRGGAPAADCQVCIASATRPAALGGKG